jgi:hypothetical protein
VAGLVTTVGATAAGAGVAAATVGFTACAPPSIARSGGAEGFAVSVTSAPVPYARARLALNADLA